VEDLIRNLRPEGNRKSFILTGLYMAMCDEVMRFGELWGGWVFGLLGGCVVVCRGGSGGTGVWGTVVCVDAC
jgi:hypothetical protein